jgi:protein SCO1
MRRNLLIWLFVPLVSGVPISFYAASLYWQREFAALPVLSKEVIPTFNLTNQAGIKYTGDEWNNKIVVVNFFFTHCPTICVSMTKNLKKVQQSFTDKDISIASISVDPESDNPGRLTWYARQFGIDTVSWQLFTGDKREIYKLARNGFKLVATDGDGGPDDFIHSEKLVLLDTQKRIRGYYDGTSQQEVQTLIDDIKKLKHETKH